MRSPTMTMLKMPRRLWLALFCLLLASSDTILALEEKLTVISSVEGEQQGSSKESKKNATEGPQKEDSEFPLYTRLVANTSTGSNGSLSDPHPSPPAALAVASSSIPAAAASARGPVSERVVAFRGAVQDYAKYQVFAGVVTVDGTTGGVAIPSQSIAAAKGIGAAFTIAFSVFPIEYSRANITRLFANGVGQGDCNPSVWILPESGKLEYRVATTVYKDVWGTSSRELPLWRWTHVALTSDGLGRLELYLDGHLDSSVAVVGVVISNSGPLTVGGNPSGLEGASLSGLVAQLAYLPFRLHGEAVWLEAESARSHLPILEEFAEPFAKRAAGDNAGGSEERVESGGKMEEESILEAMQRASKLEEQVAEEAGGWGSGNVKRGRELLTEAMTWHEEAAVGGQFASHHSLAVLLAGGLHTEANEGRAVFHLLIAATGAKNEAAMALGWRHASGRGLPQCNWTAMWYYERLAREVYGKLQDPEEQLTLEQVRLSEATRTDRADDLAGERSDLAEALRLRAQQGDAPAAVAVAQRYLHGLGGMPRDAAEALRFFRIAHGRGHAHATLGLARMNLFGEGGLAKNYTQAYEHYKAVADKEDAAAALTGLGYLHFHGLGTEQNYTLALELFRRAAARGSLDAMMNVGLLLRHGWATDRDPVAAVAYFRDAAAYGHTPSAYQMALALVDGDGVARSLGEAARYFRLVAEMGKWGKPLQEGLHAYVAGHTHKALAKYQQAAEMGYSVAQYNMAWILHTEFSQGLYKDAAAKVATMYLRRVVTETDSRKSERSWAHIQLGDCHYYGTSACAPDMREAVVQYRQAAALDEPQALFNLALMHESGLGGLPCDLARAESIYKEIWESKVPGKEAALAALIHIRAVRLWRSATWHCRSLVRYIRGEKKALALWNPQPNQQIAAQADSQARGIEGGLQERERLRDVGKGEQSGSGYDWMTDVEDFLLGFLSGMLAITVFRIWWVRNVRAMAELHQVPTVGLGGQRAEAGR